MPWKCPACGIDIQRAHGQHESQLYPGLIYRCHVCRLDWVIDPKLNLLVIAPLIKDLGPYKSEFSIS